MDVYHGVRWSAVSRYGTQGAQFVISLALARILLPEYYGLVEMAWVVVGFVEVLRNFGFAQSIIQRPSIDEELLSSLFFLNVGVSGLLMGLLAACTPLIEMLFHNDQVGLFVIALSSTFVLSSLSMVPGSLLNRNMAFEKLALVDISAVLMQGTVAVSLALTGFGAWSLVIGAVTAEVVRPVIYLWIQPWRPKWHFRWSDIRSVMKFGGNLTGFTIFNYFARKADNAIIGSMLGATPLGLYGFAYRFLLLPSESISGVLGRVMFPAYARMQNDDARLSAAYLRTCGAIALLSFPAMLGLTAIAGPFVQAAVGPRWMPAVPLIMIFAPLGALQSIATTTGQLYMAKGRTDWMFRWGVCSGILVVASFIVGVQWGIMGVTVCYGAVGLVILVPSFWFCFKLVDGLTVGRLLRELRPYALYSGTMALTVYAVRLQLEAAGMRPVFIVGICVPIGVVLYTGLVLWKRPPAMHDFLRLLPGRWAALVPGNAQAAA